jgi:CheY-like chemotaxis protein
VKPDLVFADVMMPRLGGLDLLAEVRKDPDVGDVPVVVITAFAGERGAAVAAGANAFIVKPFDPDELTATVEELLQAPR